MQLARRSSISLLVVACTPGAAPADGGSSEDTGSETQLATSSTSTSTSTSGTASSGADETTGLDGSADLPPPIDWCMLDQALSVYLSEWRVRVVSLDERSPPVLWREPTSGTSHLVTRFLGYGPGEETLYYMQRPTHGWLVFGDVDGDGWTDAIDHDHGSELARWYRGDPELGLAMEPEPLDAPPGYGLQIATDFSGDGLLDVAIGNNHYTDLVSAVGDGTGTFTAVDSHNFDPRGGYLTADFHPLGSWEWFLVQHEGCGTCEGGGLALGSIAADGTIVEHRRIDGIRVSTIYGHGLHDDDEIPDPMVLHYVPDGISQVVWLDSGSGPTFEISPIMPVEENVDLFDVNDDGLPEMIRRTPAYTYEIRQWNGTEYGPPEPIYGLPKQVVYFRTDRGSGDFDGDGWTDYYAWVTENPNDGTVIGDELWTILPCAGA